MKVAGVEILGNKKENSTITRVLYAKITDGGEKLQEIGEILKKEFADKVFT